ncbi:GYF domain-containing protein [Luteimonas sp. BDR2-5]|uniref:pilin n=1 Tax=Proluteimonas luteida TaxID=2878685 RepID=UPI001E298E36|nr:pilin [Luteimonas sp. BDR2-5]MCD9027349.1 GYF domain-containing protein [Luteimonas sp. BDR2-5]
MSDWYYLDSARHRHGPVPGDDLVRLLQSGALHAGTPVWREGMADWQSLSAVLPSLGIAVPPPLPPSAAPAPRRGNPGCWIALAVAAAFGVVVVAILAAIALPAYRDYVQRAKVAEAVVGAAPLRAAIAGHVAATGHCPDAGAESLEFALATARTSPRLGEVHIQDTGGRCGFKLLLRGMDDPRLDGATLRYTLDPEDGSWQCESTLDARYLSADCRR